MKIRYKKRYLRANFVIGLLWLFVFAIGVLIKEKLHWTDYGWLLVSGMYFGLFLYHKKYKYVSVENGFIKENGFFGKKMKLKEVKWIRKFAGDYILRSDDKQLRINTQLIDPDSLLDLNAALEKLNVRWD